MIPDSLILEPLTRDKFLGSEARCQGGGGREKFLIPVGIFFWGCAPPRGGGGAKKVGPTEKKLCPMLHVLHIIRVFPPHNMPLALVGIPLFGHLGY